MAPEQAQQGPSRLYVIKRVLVLCVYLFKVPSGLSEPLVLLGHVVLLPGGVPAQAPALIMMIVMKYYYYSS